MRLNSAILFLDANLLASILTAVFLIVLYWFLDFKDFYD